MKALNVRGANKIAKSLCVGFLCLIWVPIMVIEALLFMVSAVIAGLMIRLR